LAQGARGGTAGRPQAEPRRSAVQDPRPDDRRPAEEPAGEALAGLAQDRLRVRPAHHEAEQVQHLVVAHGSTGLLRGLVTEDLRLDDAGQTEPARQAGRDVLVLEDLARAV